MWVGTCIHVAPGQHSLTGPYCWYVSETIYKQLILSEMSLQLNSPLSPLLVSRGARRWAGFRQRRQARSPSRVLEGFPPPCPHPRMAFDLGRVAARKWGSWAASRSEGSVFQALAFPGRQLCARRTMRPAAMRAPPWSRAIFFFSLFKSFLCFCPRPRRATIKSGAWPHIPSHTSSCLE